MAFVRKVGGTYWWAGIIREPDENGDLIESEVRLKFKRIGFKQSKGYDTDADLLKAIVVDWSGVQDETGKDIPFSKKELADLINDQFYAISFSQIYFDALNKARTGN